MRKKVAIIGGGPAGCTCAIYASTNSNLDITIFDSKDLLTTILPTGNGRCNFAYGEFDFMELAKFYPRGEKFLYSVFSQFSTADTLKLFEKLGIEYYMQDDYRYFPKSNSSKTVQTAFLNYIKTCETIKFVQQNISSIHKFIKNYDYVVLSTGANKYILDNLKNIGVPVVDFSQSLVALIPQEKYLKQLPGVTLNNVSISYNDKNIVNGDILITHNALSGPAIYKLSSLLAFEKFPYKIYFNFTNFNDYIQFEKYFEEIITKNNNKNLVNVVSKFVPASFAELLLVILNVDKSLKCNQLKREYRNKIATSLFEFEVNIINAVKHGETVKAGGVNTDFIDTKSMLSKKIKNLFVIGELLNVDGFCGGFNLQNCWSTGAICGKYLSDANS